MPSLSSSACYVSGNSGMSSLRSQEGKAKTATDKVVRVWILEPDCLGSDPRFAT